MLIPKRTPWDIKLVALGAYGLWFLGTGSSFLFSPSVRAESDKEFKANIRCNREPEVEAADPQFYSKDPCSGNVKIQGIAYKCGTPSEVTDKTREFLNDLRSQGREYCAEFCRKRGKDCQSRFLAPDRCGHSIPADKAEEMGVKIAGCGSHCSGKAFMYCSIYHASYLKVDDSMFKNKNPNCICTRKKKK